ncbi:hypothetical protein BDN71DRAFT_1456402 [Pleurotus eryngii]|uniref:Uncharacterized protein n=1 Tax=Pleurotus eryngii TaxID=5323 RepID=A0A9P6DB55_PLEER|nr:hypothetical protein BDN71DRAFT_1456402 [Pleurotus eryngii]
MFCARNLNSQSALRNPTKEDLAPVVTLTSTLEQIQGPSSWYVNVICMPNRVFLN